MMQLCHLCKKEFGGRWKIIKLNQKLEWVKLCDTCYQKTSTAVEVKNQFEENTKKLISAAEAFWATSVSAKEAEESFRIFLELHEIKMEKARGALK